MGERRDTIEVPDETESSWIKSKSDEGGVEFGVPSDVDEDSEMRHHVVDTIAETVAAAHAEHRAWDENGESERASAATERVDRLRDELTAVTAIHASGEDGVLDVNEAFNETVRSFEQADVGDSDASEVARAAAEDAAADCLDDNELEVVDAVEKANEQIDHVPEPRPIGNARFSLVREHSEGQDRQGEL